MLRLLANDAHLRIRPRLAVSIAPKVAFSGLFCETLEMGLVPTPRGDVRVHKGARERVGRPVPCALGERTAENRFLCVTFAAVSSSAARGVVRWRGKPQLLAAQVVCRKSSGHVLDV